MEEGEGAGFAPLTLFSTGGGLYEARSANTGAKFPNEPNAFRPLRNGNRVRRANRYLLGNERSALEVTWTLAQRSSPRLASGTLLQGTYIGILRFQKPQPPWLPIKDQMLV